MDNPMWRMGADPMWCSERHGWSRRSSQGQQWNSVILPQPARIPLIQSFQSPAPSVASTESFSGPGTDWQEEIDEKIKSMKELYLSDVCMMYKKISTELKELESLGSPIRSQKQEPMQNFKSKLECAIRLFQMHRSNYKPGMKNILANFEKQISAFLHAHRIKRGQSQLPCLLSTDLNHTQTPELPSQVTQTQRQMEEKLSQQQHKQKITQQQQSRIQPHLLCQQQMQRESILQRTGHADISSISHTKNTGKPQTAHVTDQCSSFIVDKPGLSASPLLGGSPGSQQSNVNIVMPGADKSTMQPLDHLLKVVLSSSSEALCSASYDMASVLNMINSASGTVAEYSGSMSTCHMQHINLKSQEDGEVKMNMKRKMNVTPFSIMSTANNVNTSFKQSTIHSFESESVPEARAKRFRSEVVHHSLVEEIGGINQQLFDTIVDITDKGGEEGTIVQFTYSAVTLSIDLKSQFVLGKMFPVSPLLLKIPATYPLCSPILLDKVVCGPSEEDSETFYFKAESRFKRSLCVLPQPISLKQMARTWDACVRAVILEYAEQYGGGSFSTRYGSWQNLSRNCA